MGDDGDSRVTPLWCAAVAGRLEVVRSLVGRGADVNALCGGSDYRSTPVYEVCSATRPNVDVVKCLLENGADVHRPYGLDRTCLMASVGHAGLCDVLLRHGASVSTATARDGCTALHLAVRENRLETVRVLLRHGCDSSLRDGDGLDVFQCAALRRHAAVLRCLVDELKPTARTRADAYSLMGASFADRNDGRRAMACWYESVAIRTSESVPAAAAAAADPAEDVDTNPVYDGAARREAGDFDSLRQIDGDDDAIFSQALVVRARILGPRNIYTYFALCDRAERHVDARAYRRAVVLLKYALSLRRHSDALRLICSAFWMMLHEGDTGLRFVDVADALAMTVDEIGENSAAAADEDFPMPDLFHLPMWSIRLVHVLCQLMSTDAERSSTRQHVRDLVNTGYRSSRAYSTLLHLAISKVSSFVYRVRQ